jgi:hypothetical protein
MTSESSNAPRCSECEHVLPRPGAVCHVCDVELHFEGLLRTAPPLFTHRRARGPQPRSDRQAS